MEELFLIYKLAQLGVQVYLKSHEKPSPPKGKKHHMADETAPVVEVTEVATPEVDPVVAPVETPAPDAPEAPAAPAPDADAPAPDSAPADPAPADPSDASDSDDDDSEDDSDDDGDDSEGD